MKQVLKVGNAWSDTKKLRVFGSTFVVKPSLPAVKKPNKREETVRLIYTRPSDQIKLVADWQLNLQDTFYGSLIGSLVEPDGGDGCTVWTASPFISAYEGYLRCMMKMSKVDLPDMKRLYECANKDFQFSTEKQSAAGEKTFSRQVNNIESNIICLLSAIDPCVSSVFQFKMKRCRVLCECNRSGTSRASEEFVPYFVDGSECQQCLQVYFTDQTGASLQTAVDLALKFTNEECPTCKTKPETSFVLNSSSTGQLLIMCNLNPSAVKVFTYGLPHDDVSVPLILKLPQEPDVSVCIII